MKKKEKIAFILILFFISGLIIFLNRTTESKIPDFPVPVQAKYISNLENIDYQYNGTCFSNGLSLGYSLHIRLAGWIEEKEGEEGSMIKYKKNKRTVILIQGENKIYLYEDLND